MEIASPLKTDRSANGLAAYVQSTIQWRRLTVPGIVALQLLLTLPLAARLDIGIDEEYTLRTTARDLPFALHQALHFELQPPLYFTTLTLWRQFGESVFVSRLFSIVCVAASVFVVSGLARRFVPRVHPAWLVAAVAFNPFAIWAALDIRVYAFAILLSSLLLLLFHDGFLKQNGNRAVRTLYAVIAVAGLYTQYYMGFLLVANAAALVVLKRWQALRDYMLWMVLVAVCFAPMLAVVPNQVTAHTGTVAESPSPVASLRHVFWNMQEYLLSAVWSPLRLVGKWAWRMIAAAVAATLIWKSRSFIMPEVTRRQTGQRCDPIKRGLRNMPARLLCFATERNSNVAIWTVTAVCILFFAAVTMRTGTELLQIRHSVALFLPVLLGAYALIQAIGGRRAVAVCSVLMLAWNSMPVFALHCEPHIKGGDWREVSQYLMDNEQDGEPIVVFVPEVALPLARRYSGTNRIVPIPREEDCVDYDMREYVLTSEADIKLAIDRVAPHHESIWLVTNGAQGYLGVDFGWDVLDRFVATHYTVVRTKQFYRTKVRLLRRKLDETVDGSPPSQPRT